jgi:hypothetical protein
VKVNRKTRSIIVGLAVVSMLLIGLLAGCASSTTSTSTPTAPADTSTAKKAFAVAMSTLSTAAPDGKLLVLESGGAITPTSTPSWQFLIGSPKTGTIYAVNVVNGKGQFQEYGPSGLSAAEWAAVPSIDAWKIDSDAAYQKAVVVHPGGKSAPYIVGFVTYIPKSAGKTTTKAMQWLVTFDPKAQGKAPTSTVDVDVTTGAAAYAK